MQDTKNILSIDLLRNNLLTAEEPPSDSLFWKLWNSSKKTAEKALQTGFLMGLRNGDLDPVQFGAFMVSDAYYCFKGTEYYEAAERRTDDPLIKEFLIKKIENYNEYNERFHSKWFLRDADSILAPPICKEYCDYGAMISNQEEPIYTMILMLPCEFLWAWACKSMLPTESGNIYGNWIREGNIPEIAYAMGNFLDLYLKMNPNKIDENKAMEIYRKAMEYEYQYFMSATK